MDNNYSTVLQSIRCLVISILYQSAEAVLGKTGTVKSRKYEPEYVPLSYDIPSIVVWIP